MRALIKKFNNMSIRIRLMILAALLSLMAGSIVVAVLLKNSKTAGKSADYLEHFSQISQIYELNAQNTEAIKELKKSDDEKDQTLSGQITGNINKMKVLLDEVDNEVLSSQERMRVETVQYLTEYFENSFEKYKEEYQDELYTDCMYTIDRINSFAQEILRLAGKTIELKSVPTEQSDLSSVRPPYAVLDNFILRIIEMYDMPEWKESLKEYMDERTEG